MNMKYIDICINPAKTEEETLALIRSGLERDVISVVDASSIGSCRRVSALLDAYPDLPFYATMGVHPHNADSFTPQVKEELRELLKKKRVVAAGETGLDFDRMFSPKEAQISAMKEQLRLAEEAGMPVLLHERSAADAFCEVFREFPETACRSVVHCFTGDRAQLKRYLDMGFFIGITGWITDERRNAELLYAAGILPLDRVLLETDSPYLKPRIKGLKGQNTPANVPLIAEALAKAMGTDEETLRLAALANAKRLFGIEDDDGSTE